MVGHLTFELGVCIFRLDADDGDAMPKWLYYNIEQQNLLVFRTENVKAWLYVELKLPGVSDGRRRPVVHGGEMVKKGGRWPRKAAVQLRAEAWGVRAFLLVSFFLVVGELVCASIFGIGARDHD